MEETVESTGMTETKKIPDNPRVEIDTSPPFESVKEAVDWFSGSGPWMQHHLLRLASHDHRHVSEKMEEQAVQLERDLMLKEQETLNLLKQLEAAKRLVETLKCHLIPEFSPFLASPHQNLETGHRRNDSTEDWRLLPVLSPGLMFMELNRAKTNLNKTSIDLAMIQESVESLNEKMTRDKALLGRRMEMEAPDCGDSRAEAKGRLENCTNITEGLLEREADFETEQFKKMTEASRYEVMKAMAEIERTKNSIKMAEMRLNAAKKMEEAAKAVEEIALAERNLTSPDVFLDDHKRNGITLSFEEYRSLTQKAHQVEEICKTKFIDANTIQTRSCKDHQSEATVTEKSEEMKQENQQSRVVADFRTKEDGSLPNDQDRYSKFKFRNSRSGGHRTAHVANENGSNGTTSMGDILSRKLILQDDIFVGKHHGERGHVSLSQMLREQSRTILHPGETAGDEHGRVERSFFVQRKKFGFIQVPLSIKKNKKKAQT